MTAVDDMDADEPISPRSGLARPSTSTVAQEPHAHRSATELGIRTRVEEESKGDGCAAAPVARPS
jgi:hypothetical protein